MHKAKQYTWNFYTKRPNMHSTIHTETIISEYINVHLYEGIVSEMNVGIDGRRISNRTEILRTF